MLYPPEQNLHGRSLSEDKWSSNVRRDSLGSTERRNLPAANPVGAQSLLSLSQTGMRAGSVSKSFSDLPAAAQPPLSPPGENRGTLESHHMLPLNLAEGDKVKPKGKSKRPSFFRQKKT